MQASGQPRSSLADSMVGVLVEADVPIPTGALRVLVSVLRAEPIGAQRLARIANYERQNFSKTGRSPRLCWAIEPDGTAPRTRIWALPEWRLARRLITSDAMVGWEATTALYVCHLVLDAERTDERLADLAHQFGSRALGPIAASRPASADEWMDLREALRAVPLGPGVTTHTSEQGRAEKALERAELTDFSLYFGLERASGILSGRAPRELRLALGAEPDGLALDELIRKRATNPAVAREVIAYIEGFDRLSSELGRPPSQGEYAERWNLDLEQSNEQRRLFRSLFPGEEDPAAIAGMLWDGIGQGPSVFSRLLGVKVRVDAESPTVISYFANCLADEIREKAGQDAYKAAVTMEEHPSNPRRELKRFFSLCARAVEGWCAGAIAGLDDDAYLESLRRLEPVTDESSAESSEQAIGEYRLLNKDMEGKQVLLSTQKALRVAASLDSLNPTQTTLPYLDGIHWAAKALVAAHRELGVDIAAEAGVTARRLDAVY